MNTPLLIINGVSGSGKTTAMKHVIENWRYNDTSFLYLHPIARLKRFLEQQYQCPNLDTKEGKEFIPKGCNNSMQDIMVRMWEVFVKEKLDPAFSQRMLHQELLDVPHHHPLIFNAIRNIEEVTFLIDLAKDRNMSIFFIRLKPLSDVILNAPSSDENEQKIAELLFTHAYKSAIVSNPMTYEFFNNLDTILSNWFASSFICS